jgi:hypothetical protein
MTWGPTTQRFETSLFASSYDIFPLFFQSLSRKFFLRRIDGPRLPATNDLDLTLRFAKLTLHSSRFSRIAKSPPLIRRSSTNQYLPSKGSSSFLPHFFVNSFFWKSSTPQILLSFNSCTLKILRLPFESFKGPTLRNFPKCFLTTTLKDHSPS